jgi:hypothetical protein
MAGSVVRNARASRSVESPQTTFNVRAARASGAMAGWQQTKISRSRSSGMGSSAAIRTSSGVGGAGSAGSNTARSRVAARAGVDGPAERRAPQPGGPGRAAAAAGQAVRAGGGRVGEGVLGEVEVP